VKTLNQYIGQKGASAVEFAIVLPLLVTFVFGIIEFSICFYNKAMLTNASREGARAGIVYAFPNRLCDAEIQNVITNYLSTSLITFGAVVPPAININPPGCRAGAAPGDPLIVTVDYHYDFLVLPNLIASLVGGTDLRAVTIMRME